MPVELERVLKSLGAITGEIEHALKKTMYEEASLVMSASQAQVPVDTGALRSTGVVGFPETRGSEISVVLGYGGPAGANNSPINRLGRSGRPPSDEVGYAVKVHEDKEAHHEVGKAKFLEEPFAEAAPRIGRAMINAVTAAAKTVK